MPGWSPEIANEFIIRNALATQNPLGQAKLQRLVYIAHGHVLALTGQPLTGDRPEAWVYGPVYRRLADAVAPWGKEAITRPIMTSDLLLPDSRSHAEAEVRAELDEAEYTILDEVYNFYASVKSEDLSVLTRGETAPWRSVSRHRAVRLRLVINSSGCNLNGSPNLHRASLRIGCEHSLNEARKAIESEKVHLDAAAHSIEAKDLEVRRLQILLQIEKLTAARENSKRSMATLVEGLVARALVLGLLTVATLTCMIRPAVVSAYPVLLITARLLASMHRSRQVEINKKAE